MPKSDSEYLKHCISLIEQELSFSNPHTQRDLELLSKYIEEKEGIKISLSTLKRIWKGDFKKAPQLATLNALVGVVQYKDWQHFKLAHNHSSKKTINAGNDYKKWTFRVLPGLVVLTLFYLFIAQNQDDDDIKINGPVIFEANQTKSFGVPNTTIFKYDVSNVHADSFFIQQSWNQWRRRKIDPNLQNFSSIYYESGFHRARLIANDSVISMVPIHILSNGWEAHAYKHSSDHPFIDFKNEKFISDGSLHLTKDLLKKRNVEIKEPFVARITNSKEFDVSSDNFGLNTRMKLDTLSTNNCNWMIIQIVTEVHVFYIKLVNTGCEAFAAYKMGEVVKFGDDNDLKHLGTDLFQWQDLSVSVEDKKATISLNNEVIYTQEFKESFGDIKALTYLFDGSGYVDHLELINSNKETVYETDFNSQDTVSVSL